MHFSKKTTAAALVGVAASAPTAPPAYETAAPAYSAPAYGESSSSYADGVSYSSSSSAYYPSGSYPAGYGSSSSYSYSYSSSYSYDGVSYSSSASAYYPSGSYPAGYGSSSSSYSYGPVSGSSSSSYYVPSATSSYPFPSASSAFPECWSSCFSENGVTAQAELCGNDAVSACVHETCDEEDDKAYWAWYESYCPAASSSSSYSYGPVTSAPSTSYPSGYPTSSSSYYVEPVSSSGAPYYPEHPGNDGGFGGKGECYGHGGSGSGVGGGEGSPVSGGDGSDGTCPAGCYSSAPSCPSEGDGGFCLSDADAQTVADIFQELIQNYSDELALAALTEDFTDWTSAVGIIIEQIGAGDVNLLEPLFVGRDAFMAAQGSQPEIPFTQTHVFHGCNSVSMRWYTTRSAAGQPTEVSRIPVVGNVILEVVPSSPGDEYNFRIKQIFSEFNSAAWLLNLGVFKDHSGGASLDKRDFIGANMLGATLK